MSDIETPIEEASVPQMQSDEPKSHDDWIDDIRTKIHEAQQMIAASNEHGRTKGKDYAARYLRDADRALEMR